MASLLQTVRSRTVLQRYPDPKAPYYLASPYTEDHQHVYTSTVDGRHPRPGLLSPPRSSLLPEGCPPQQVQSPPSYHESLNQPGHSSLQPVTTANTTIVLAQPLVVATISSPPKESRGGDRSDRIFRLHVRPVPLLRLSTDYHSCANPRRLCSNW